MTKVSGSTYMKIQNIPSFWDIPRKMHRFVLKPIPGPYAISESYPLGVLLRDILHISNTMREVKNIIKEGKIKIDGKIRYNEHFPVGLMNTISINDIHKHYRLVPNAGRLLVPIEIDEQESKLKICKIRNKITIKGNKVQYGLNDGRVILNNINAKPNDSLLLKVPEQEILQIIRLEKGANSLIIKGDNIGKLGIIEEVKDGTYTLPKRAVIRISDKIIELPVNMMIVVGNNNNIPIKVK